MVRDFAAALNEVTQPILTFLGTDWGQIGSIAVTIGGAAVGISLFAKAVRTVASALYFLSGARAGVAVLSALGVISGSAAGAGAAAGAAGVAGVVGRNGLGKLALSRFGLPGMVGAGLWAGGDWLGDKATCRSGCRRRRVGSRKSRLGARASRRRSLRHRSNGSRSTSIRLITSGRRRNSGRTPRARAVGL
ncbi:hypothetical protein GCM10017653_41130 [Ancylobacter defluvii]|uniref:Uncharacterized protein n=1 Tax=Ancylobacter defluvii TaxID=1282440 RepID=A0A9W6K0Q1_9HYPH|nr:hypothetical protein GCM10017653_41130 [Ancylobacter defluvii]